MKILYIVHDNKKGGAALSFLEMISIIRKEHDVYVLVPHKDGYLPEQLDKMGISYKCVPYFWWKIVLPQKGIKRQVKKNFYKVLNLWNNIEANILKKEILAMRIDIIHSNSSVINIGALLSKKTGIPHVWHLREYGEEDFGLESVVSMDTYKKVMQSEHNKFIAISESIKKKYSEIVDSKRITKIYNGISDLFCHEKGIQLTDGNEVKFLLAGNCCKEKGQEDVVKAVMKLREEQISNFKMYFAGNGDFSEIQKLVQQNDLQDQVVFMGLVDDMVQLRKEMDVEIVASRYEAFGRVTIEAMRMSNPVIGTNTGGTPELIQSGYNGFLFEYGNIEQLAECMKKFIQDKSLLNEMGMNAYRSCCNKYTVVENAKKVIDEYIIAN